MKKSIDGEIRKSMLNDAQEVKEIAEKIKKEQLKKFRVTWYDTNEMVVSAKTEEEAIEKIKKLYDENRIVPDAVFMEARYEAKEVRR